MLSDETKLRIAGAAMSIDPIRICESYDKVTEVVVPIAWGLGLILVPAGLIVLGICAVLS